MAAGTVVLYQRAVEGFGDGSIDLDTDTFHCAFISAGYTPADSHSIWSQVSGNEISSDGYTAGGPLLADVAYDVTGSKKVKWTCSPFTVSGSGTKKVKYGVIYDSSASANARLIGYFDMETTSSTGVEATQITVTFPSNVIFKATIS